MPEKKLEAQATFKPKPDFARIAAAAILLIIMLIMMVNLILMAFLPLYFAKLWVIEKPIVIVIAVIAFIAILSMAIDGIGAGAGSGD